MPYIDGSEELVGYRVRIEEREAFCIAGYALLVPAKSPPSTVPDFWTEITEDGRFDRLVGCLAGSPRALGLGSWDPECEPHGFRYTVCFEEADGHDFAPVAGEKGFYSQSIGASSWMVFESVCVEGIGAFWKANPYKMLAKLGYEFHSGAPDVGLHFESYHHTADEYAGDIFDFWITVNKPSA